MTARERLRHCVIEQKKIQPLPDGPPFVGVAVGYVDYAELQAEVLMGLAENWQHSDVELSQMLEKHHIRHFIYNGLPVFRLAAIERGFFFL